MNKVDINWIFVQSSNWSLKIRAKLFLYIFEGEVLYRAGLDWNITNDMRKKVFDKLEGEWLYNAGLFWPGITDEMRRKVFHKLEGKWLCLAGKNWKGITKN